MKERMLHFLERFMIENDWDYENIPERARALFTAMCLMENIDADHPECGKILVDLYFRAALEELLEYDEFDQIY